jgi:hypothetical protein
MLLATSTEEIQYWLKRLKLPSARHLWYLICILQDRRNQKLLDGWEALARLPITEALPGRSTRRPNFPFLANYVLDYRVRDYYLSLCAVAQKSHLQANQLLQDAVGISTKVILNER